MSRLWLFYFPLLFLPNLGYSQKTPFGVVEISDLLIGPFIFLLVITPSAKYQPRISKLIPLLLGFLAWACFTIVTIHFRYDYVGVVPVLIGCSLKLAKLALYVTTGVLIARRITSSRVRKQWLWSLLAALAMLAVGVLMSSNEASAQSIDNIQGYKSYNDTIVAMAILCSYIGGLWIDNLVSRKWRLSAGIVLAFAICSWVLSASVSAHGRGGWLALIIGCGYCIWKRTLNIKALSIALFLALMGTVGYNTLPNFRLLVDSTISSQEDQDIQLISGLDEGGRVSTWEHEAPKFIDAPLLGTGFYHRGGASGLWDTGAHNFFIQLFLETGLVGGTLVLAVFALMWSQAGSVLAHHNRTSLATRGALITAFVAGMSGEYYYGGTSVLVLFAIFASVASLPVIRTLRPSHTPSLQTLRLQQAAP